MLCDILFFFKQKTAYERRISDLSSDVCSSDLIARLHAHLHLHRRTTAAWPDGFVEKAFLDGDTGGQRIALLRKHDKQPVAEQLDDPEIGRASCRERVCQYV